MLFNINGVILLKYKIIAFDLDGTLLNDVKEIPEENLRMLHRAAECGVQLVPATGRIYPGLPEQLRALPFVRYCICVNGAQVYDAWEKKVICRAEIPAARAIELAEFMDGLPVIYDCYQDDWGWMSGSMYAKIDEYISDPGVALLTKKTRTAVDDLKATLRERGTPVQKMQMHFNNPAQRLHWLAELPALWPDISVTSSISSNIELNSLEANKGAALKTLCGLLGVGLEETLAFGDGSNDLTMLSAAGTGAAMLNASDNVKAAADIVTEADNNCAGVAQTVYRLMPEIGGACDE